MVFKRRNPRGLLSWARQMVYPDGGFRRATQYVIHRMRRLPDRPHRIARGIFAGTFIGFLPLPGAQFLGAWLLAWLIRGNIPASLLATFISNPITTPIIAVFSISLGHWILGNRSELSPEMIMEGFTKAGAEVWDNFLGIFTSTPVEWGALAGFWHEIYKPYLIGSMIPALATSLLFYYITIPLVIAYQKARAAKAKERHEKRRRLQSAVKDRDPAATDPADPREKPVAADRADPQ